MSTGHAKIVQHTPEYCRFLPVNSGLVSGVLFDETSLKSLMGFSGLLKSVIKQCRVEK